VILLLQEQVFCINKQVVEVKHIPFDFKVLVIRALGNIVSYQELIYQALEGLALFSHSGKILGLEAGCGHRSPLAKAVDDFPSLEAHIVGLDLNEKDLKFNPRLDSRIKGTLFFLPFKDHSFQVINCRFIFEHLENPEQVLAEFFRVLKPGGFLVFWTVNKWNYSMIFSRLTPHWFHNLFRRLSFGARKDNVPAYYRLNTVKELEASFERHGFEKIKIFYRGGAYLYLQFTNLTYFFGLVLNLIAQSPVFKKWQLFIFGIFQKKRDFPLDKESV